MVSLSARINMMLTVADFYAEAHKVLKYHVVIAAHTKQ